MALMLESLESLGKHLAKSQDSFDETLKRLATGRGNLKRRAEALRQLGGKGKKELPAGLMSRIDSAAYEEEAELAEAAIHTRPALPASARESA